MLYFFDHFLEARAEIEKKKQNLERVAGNKKIFCDFLTFSLATYDRNVAVMKGIEPKKDQMKSKSNAIN